MSVEYGLVVGYGMVYKDQEAWNIYKLRLDGIIDDDDWDNYFIRINSWGSAEDGMIFGLFNCFSEMVTFGEDGDDIFPSIHEIFAFESKIREKPWFKKLRWEPKKIIAQYCY